MALNFVDLVVQKPRGEVVLLLSDGKPYRTFICHGCQSCWQFDGDCDKVVECYPHFIAPPEEVLMLSYHTEVTC